MTPRPEPTIRDPKTGRAEHRLSPGVQAFAGRRDRMSQTAQDFAAQAIQRVAEARSIADQARPNTRVHELLVQGVFLLEDVAVMFAEAAATGAVDPGRPSPSAARASQQAPW